MSGPAMYNDLDDERPLVRLEVSDDVWLAEVVRALNAGGLTLSNVPGRGLRIVRFPTPGKEDRK